jgi:hemoglobin/transferrin/lactoferrin receptor protein
MRYLLLLLPLLPASAEAQITADSTSLHELVVTANRDTTERFGTPAAIQALDKKHTARFQPRSTPELFQNVVGVFVQKTNHGGGSPFLRGLTGNQTLLLFDGIRLNNATYRYGPNQYLNTVDVFGLERAEVLRGSGSVQYGSDALGGTIQLFSQHADFHEKNTWHGRVVGRLWSQNMEQTTRGELGFSGKRTAFRGGFTYRHFGDLVGGDTTGLQSPTGYDERAFDLKSGFRIASQTTLTLAHNEVQQQQVPVFHKVRLEDFKINEFEPQLRRLSYARVEGQTTRPLLEHWYIIASRQQTREGRISQKNGSNIRRDERDDVQTYGLSSNVHSRFSAHWTANSGVEMYRDQVGSTRQDVNTTDGSSVQKRGLYPNNAGMLSWAVFSIHTYDLRDWKLEAGSRFNGFRIEVQDEAVGAVTLRPSAFVWNVALQRCLSTSANLFASYHSGFRAPNIDDLGTLGIVDFRYEVPNYALRPERSHNTQLGLKYQHRRLRGEAFIFRNELRDLISRVKTADSIQNYPIYQKENTERAYIQGVETQWAWAVLPHFFAECHLTYTYGQNLTRREPVRRIPPLNGRLALRFQPHERYFVLAEWLAADAQTRLAQGDRDDNRIPAGGTPGWSVLNLHGGYTWRGLQAQVTVHNLLNSDYRLHGSGVNGVGRSASLALSFAF